MILFFKKIIIGFKGLWSILSDNNLNDSETYFPEIGERKKKWTIIIEQIKHFVKYRSINNFYFLYGFDRINYRNVNDYVDYEKFRRKREVLNHRNNNAPISLLRNKFLFGIFAEKMGILTPKNIAYIRNGKIYILQDNSEINLDEFVKCNNIDAFLKVIDGECADGVFHIIINNGVITIDDNLITIDDLRTLLLNKSFILQKRIKQCEALSKLHPQSINTIRVETIWNIEKQQIEILPPLLRIGTKGKSVDNWAVGGLAVMINLKESCLGKYGFYKPHFGTKVAMHPDTNIVFEGYEIPFMSEAIEQVKFLHSFLTDIHSIGGYIAITEQGPCIIEGNDNWEISLVQICSHGLMNEFNSMFK